MIAAFAERFAEWPGATFTAQVLGAGDTYGVAHWRVASGELALDGVWVVALDPRGRCESLRQWWHVGRVKCAGAGHECRGKSPTPKVRRSSSRRPPSTQAEPAWAGQEVSTA